MLKYLLANGAADIEALLSDPLTVLPEAERDLLRRCAAPRWFDRELFDGVIRAGCPDDAPGFEAVVGRPLVERVPGPRPLYAIPAEPRAELLRPWMGEAPAGGAPTPELAELSARLAAHFAAAGEPLEQLYHLVLADRPAAVALLAEQRVRAEATFDMAAYHALLRALDERSAVLGPELARARRETAREYESLSLWAQEYFDTADYYEREATRPLLAELLRGEQHWVLQLFAAGGMGKSMFIKATLARGCMRAVPRIPCARIDFDHVPYLAAAAAEPWRMLLSIALQLNRQLEGAPFTELLAEYGDFVAEADRHSGGQPPPPLDERERSAISDGVRRRAADILANACRDGHVLLVFDTLEVLRHRDDNLGRTFELLRGLRERVPGLRVILAGRYDLAEPESGGALSPFSAILGAGQRSVRLRGFTPAEARAYLLERRRMPDDERVAALIELGRDLADEEPRCNPFELALLADVVAGEPGITAASLRSYPTARIAYAIRRVVLRIDNLQVRWLLRYGVIPRRLTADFVAQVLLAPLHEAMTGASTDDNPLEDDLDRRILAEMPFPVRPELGAELTVAGLWATLRGYAASYSWVRPAGAPFGDALVFNDNVRAPLRRLLSAHPMYRRLQGAAAVYFEDLARDDALSRPAWLAEAAEHRLRAGSPEAEAAVLGLIAGAAPADLGPLGALFGPQRPDDLELSQGLRARAGHLLTERRLSLPRPLTDTDRDVIGQWLAPAVELAAAPDPPVHPARLAATRAAVALREDRDPAAAAELCRAGLRAADEGKIDAELRVLLARAQLALGEPAALAALAEAVLNLTSFGNSPAASAAALELARALEASERFEAAAEAYGRAAVAAGTQAEAGPALIGHVRLLTRAGYARTTGGLIRQGGALLERLDARGAGELWPSLLRAEGALAQGRPDAALRALGAAEAQLAATPGAEPAGWARERAGLRLRIFGAQFAIDAAVAECEELASRIAQTPAMAVVARLERAALIVDVVGDLLQAERELESVGDAIAGLPGGVTEQARWQLLMAICGRPGAEIRGRPRLIAEGVPEEPPSVRVTLAMGELIGRGPGEATLGALASALADVQPPGYRLPLIATLCHCHALPRGAEPALAQRLLALVSDGEQGVDRVSAFLRELDLARVLGRDTDARTILHLLEDQRSGVQGDLAYLRTRRELYRAMDRLNVGPTDWLLPEQDLPAWEAHPDLACTLAIEHADRLLAGGRPEPALLLLDEARKKLGPQTVWSGRLSELRERAERAGRDDRRSAQAPTSSYGEPGDQDLETVTLRIAESSNSRLAITASMLERRVAYDAALRSIPWLTAPDYEVVSAFVAGSDALDKLADEVCAGLLGRLAALLPPGGYNLTLELERGELSRVPWELFLRRAEAGAGAQTIFRRTAITPYYGPPALASDRDLTGGVLVVQPSAGSERATKRGHSASSGFQLHELYRRRRVEVEQVQAFSQATLLGALAREGLAAAHLLVGLRERRDQVFLDFGDADPKIDQLAARQLAFLLPSERPPLLILDVVAPSDPGELVRQLYLRNQLASELLEARPDLSIIATGLAEAEDAFAGTSVLIAALAAGDALALVPRRLWAEGAGRGTGIGATMLMSAALFTLYPSRRVRLA